MPFIRCSARMSFYPSIARISTISPCVAARGFGQYGLGKGRAIACARLSQLPNLRNSERCVSGSKLIGSSKTLAQTRDKTFKTQNYARQTKAPSTKEDRNGKAGRRNPALQRYISDVVVGSSAISDDEIDSDERTNLFDSHNRNQKRSSSKSASRNLEPVSSYDDFYGDDDSMNPNDVEKDLDDFMVMKDYQMELEEEESNKTRSRVFDGATSTSGNTLETRRGFIEQFGEYDNSSVLRVIRNRMTFYNSDTDEVMVQGLLAHVLNDSSSTTHKCLSAGITSFCRLPENRLQELASVELTSMFAKFLCRVADSLDTDTFCEGFVMLVRLHCTLLPAEIEILEKQCLNRMKSWDLDRMLLVSDCWLCLRQNKISYHQNMLSLATLYYGSELSAQHVTQMFYIIGMCKTVPAKGTVLKLLRIIQKSIGELSWLEMSAICFGLLKGGIPLSESSDKFLWALTRRFIYGLQSDQIDTYSATTIMRYISRRYHLDVDTFNVLATYLTPKINQNCAHIHVAQVAAAFAKTRMFHKALMDSIVSSVLYHRIPQRTKDIHLLLWSFGRFNYKPADSEKFFQLLIQTLHAKLASHVDYPLILLRCLVSLTFLEYYPTTLIDQAFSPDFLQICDGKKLIPYW